MNNRWLSRLSKFVGFLLGARVFMAVLLIFALYVSTFFLFNQEESLRSFVFDYKAHVIILCSFLSILAGGIINQFYDREKDKIAKPFRTRLQSFLAQRYYLYLYLALNLFSLGVAAYLSFNIFLFFLFYQFMMWFYSHKLSKLLIVNNLCFVGLTLYPFFGMLVYYHTFSYALLLMSVFLFLLLLSLDINKDILTKNPDKIFGYDTLATSFSSDAARKVTIVFLVFNSMVALLIYRDNIVHQIMEIYYLVSAVLFVVIIVLLLQKKRLYTYASLNLLRIWIFIGILSMLADGIVSYLH